MYRYFHNLSGAWAILLSFTAVSCAQQPAGFRSIDAGQFRELFSKDGGIVLDVRTTGEYKKGHVTQAVLIDIMQDDFKDKINLLDKEKTYYIYCHSGNRSSQASALMSNLGFTKVYNIKDGIANILKSGVPVSKE